MFHAKDLTLVVEAPTADEARTAREKAAEVARALEPAVTRSRVPREV